MGGRRGKDLAVAAVPAAVPPIGSVPNWLILRPHNTKGAEWLYKYVAEFWQNFY